MTVALSVTMSVFEIAEIPRSMSGFFYNLRLEVFFVITI
jgi:hypothetical protein